MKKMKDQAIDDIAELEDVSEKLVSSAPGTIGNGHFLVIVRRHVQIVAKLDKITALLAVQEDHRRRHEMQIDKLHKHMERLEQQCLHRTCSTETRQDSFENLIELADRRSYSRQQEILSKSTAIVSPLMQNVNLAAKSDISESQKNSISFGLRSDSNDFNTSQITRDAMEQCSPEQIRAFNRLQGLDVNAAPFEMPIAVPPMKRTTREFCRQGDRIEYSPGTPRTSYINHRQHSNWNLRSQGQSSLSRYQMNVHQPHRRACHKRPLPPAFRYANQKATEFETSDPQDDSLANYVNKTPTNF